MKSSLCDVGSSCVEAQIIDDSVHIRDSEDPSVVLIFTHAEWRTFIEGIKLGEFDI